MRIDKFLSNAGYGSRKEVKSLIRAGRVTLNSASVSRPEEHLDPGSAYVCLDGEHIPYVKFTYIMLNKPCGVISASFDPTGSDQTVTDLAAAAGFYGLFPVGRLDKDASGLIILTDDGVFAHRATSPRRAVPKIYDVTLADPLTDADATAFLSRITLDDGFLCLPAPLEILSPTRALITLTEGKYHQVKRMFAARANRVLTLTRISFAGIPLPQDLPQGSCRPLSETEMETVKELISKD